MEKLKILITGANSFIGKSIIELLSKDKYIIIPKTHQELDLENTQQVDEFFKNNSIDYVIHTATVGGGKREDNANIFYRNVTMFENLIGHKDKYKLMITFGSGAEFVNSFPLNFYALGKKYMTQKILQENLNCVNLRLWGCFGKYEENDRFIKANMLRYKNKEPMIVNINKSMSFFYVNDLIPVIEYYLTMQGLPIVKEIDMCYEVNAYTLIGICHIINKLNNYKVKIKLGQLESDSSYMGYSSLFLSNFKFIGLEQGIKQMWNEII